MTTEETTPRLFSRLSRGMRGERREKNRYDRATGWRLMVMVLLMSAWVGMCSAWKESSSAAPNATFNQGVEGPNGAAETQGLSLQPDSPQPSVGAMGGRDTLARD